MLRFPNPGSTLSNFVAVYVAAFNRFQGQVVDLDDIVQATIDADLATSSGHMGEQAIARSTRKDRSRDPLYNQLKMYAELFRSLGWLSSTEKSALNYTFTLLGEQVVAAGRHWHALLEETVLGIAYPSHVLDLRGEHHIRPFATILKTMLACNDGLSRDEMIVAPLSSFTDRSPDTLALLAKKVNALRDTPQQIKSALEEIKEERGIQINTLRNYTRWPLAVLRDLGWTVKDKEPYRSSKKMFEIHRLTPQGKARAISLLDTVDLRVDQIESLNIDQKRALSRKAHFSMMERSGFDLTSVQRSLNTDQELIHGALKALNVPTDKPILFSPFQSLSVADLCSIFPTPDTRPAQPHIEKKVDGIEVGRGSREHLFIAPKFVKTHSNEDDVHLLELRQELKQFALSTSTLDAAAIAFAESRRQDTQTLFYPLVTQLFQLMGFASDYSRAGVNYQRWDACLWLNKLALPIEIKSPTEELFLSTKAIRQAIENKVILLSRGGLETRHELSTLVVGYQIPNERGEMSTLIDDVHVAFKFKIGVLDLKTLAFLALKAVVEDVSVDEAQLAELKGFLNV